MTAILVCINKALRERLRELLRTWGWAVIGEVSANPASLRLIRARQPGLIIVDDEFPGTSITQLMDVLNQDRLAPVLLLLSPNNEWGEELIRHFAVMAATSKPLNETDFYLSVMLAEANFAKFREMDKEINRLRDQVQTRKSVERAKGILMETLGLSEQDAYRRMQRESMERRISMRTIADTIIAAHEFCKPKQKAAGEANEGDDGTKNVKNKGKTFGARRSKEGNGIQGEY
ncbi:MAG: ANTAR domain-containing protein [Bacillota bacterium]